MAKKSVPASPQIVHIPAAGATGSTLSKEQKAFNRFTKRISKLEKEVADFREAATHLRQRVQNEYRPLQQQHNDQRAALVRVLDHAHDEYRLTKTERDKIVDIIVYGCVDLLDWGYDDLEPIFDKHDPPLSAEEAAEVEAANVEADAETAEMMKALFSQQFGIEFEADADVSTPEKLQAYVAQQMAAQEEAFAAEEAQRAERRAKRKKSPKQQAAEEKKQAEEKNITKAVRTLYMDLVKHLHPDREPDEAEKARKTELLKQVTTAYEANELLTLLRLQLELNRIDQAHLENMAEEQLRYYNKLLREQARELEDALQAERMDLSAFSGQPWYALTSPAAMDLDYRRQKSQLQAKIKQLAAEVLAFGHDPAAVKAFLKTYKIPKDGPGPMLVSLLL
ncbi:hypothetical protein [Hymenobacter sp. NBH84]|uniref:hypothetical protein n=1 Tax=Hymenobacter sp. NBH84 TaxID=2596915 RepID=UPI0021561F9C|nr:hypothetical protein [Hymenobacter sp. NBH84]